MDEAELKQAAVLLCEHFEVRKPGMAPLIVGQAKEFARSQREALEAQVKALKEERDAQAEAVRVLGRGVLAGQLARARMRECPCTSGGAGGQTIEACLSRMRFHQVPLSIFDDLYAAEEMIHDNAIAAAAVKGGGE